MSRSLKIKLNLGLCHGLCNLMFKGAQVEKGSHETKLIVNISLGLILFVKINSSQHWKILNNEKTLFHRIFYL